MKSIKIATIGGGSSYTPELIEGFIKRRAQLPIRELWLVDVEEGKEKLEIVAKMAERMVRAAGLDWKICPTLDRKAALTDADYVTTQFRVGLLAARIKDERIPLKYGMIGQETNGAGGIMKALRTIPVVLGLIEEMKTLCPNAWLIHFTNPAGMITEASLNAGWKKTIGLCNVPISVTTDINGIFGLEPFSNKLFFKFAGLNHFHYHRVWDEAGEEITASLIDRIYHPASKVKLTGVKNIKEYPYFYEQIKDLGILPCSYHRYYYLTQQMLDDELAEYERHATRAETVKRTEDELFALYRDPALDHKPAQLAQRGGAHYSDAACEVIASIQNDKRSIMVVSTINRGAIECLPYNGVVEISSIITAHGPEPLNWGTFNAAARGPLQLMKAMEECVIGAAVHGDYGKALQAFTINPLITSGPKAKQMLDEMLIANEAYLPRFRSVIEALKQHASSTANEN